MKTLSNFELIQLSKENNIPLNGIYSRDNIPKLLNDGWYIINLDRQNAIGTHWTTFYVSKSQPNLYFDSFGFEAPQQLSNMLKHYFYNNKRIQSLQSDSCGWYCLMTIKYNSEKNNNLYEFLQYLELFVDNKPEYNEKLLENYFSHLIIS